MNSGYGCEMILVSFLPRVVLHCSKHLSSALFFWSVQCADECVVCTYMYVCMYVSSEYIQRATYMFLKMKGACGQQAVNTTQPGMRQVN